MPNFFNTVDQVQFFNFVSNNFPSGVPASLQYSYSSNAQLFNWIKNVAFTSNAYISSNNCYFRFPHSNTETALITEDIQSNASSTDPNFFRFCFIRENSSGNDLRSLLANTSGSQYKFSINTGSPGSSFFYNFAGFNSLSLSTNDSNLDTSNKHFTFSSKSPTTLVISSIKTSIDLGNLSTDFSQSGTIIAGWMHNSIYTDPLPLANQKYFGAYVIHLAHNTKTSLSYTNFNAACAREAGLSLAANLSRTYYDIICQDGQYSPGLFLTELILTDDNRQKRGKVDNRVAALGRGSFELGKIYQTVNAFGRNGVEEWLCVGSLTPSNYFPAPWSPGDDSSLEKFRFWQNNEIDWLLIRIYVTTD